jgi:hypothetical protein
MTTPYQPQSYPPPGYPPQYPPQTPQPPYQQAPYPPQYVQPGGYAPPAPPAPPAQRGSLTDYFDAPSSAEGKPWSFTDTNRQPVINASHVGIVARDLRDGDVRQQTNPNNQQPVTYRDGRPKWVMVVPMLQQPDQVYPDGRATLWVRGQMRDELMRAMKQAGCDENQLRAGPEGNAGLRVTLVSVQPVPGMNPRSIFQIEYTRPAGAVNAVTPPVQQQMQFDPPLAQPVQAAAQMAPAPPAQPVTSAASAAAEQTTQAPPVPPADMTQEQQELLARLTGQTQPQAG